MSGLTQVGGRPWLGTFMGYDLGCFDDETCRLEPIKNPFGSNALPRDLLRGARSRQGGALTFAMDLTAVVEDEKLDVLDCTIDLLRRFEHGTWAPGPGPGAADSRPPDPTEEQAEQAGEPEERLSTATRHDPS
jgi:hypothetical protein